ncbi:MAG: IS110 family transposase [Ardenticatenaceae bacterium]|nr:IS110 family transposase [Ardenticatenaceae bacterium]
MSVYMGIDWSVKKHDVAFINEAGSIIARLTIPHQASGFEKLNKTREQLDVATADCLVGLETAHNLLIDYLWGQGYEQVYVIPPSVVKSSRGRYGNRQVRTDERDARLLADLLRTDLARLQPWHPDSLQTRKIQAKVSLIHHMTKRIRRVTERLRAVLLRYYPGALALFDGLQSQITVAFIAQYNTPQAAQAISYEQFVAFARLHRYPKRWLPKQYAQLQKVQPEASLDTVAVYQEEGRMLANDLLGLLQTIRRLRRELKALFQDHPDQHIFASLPGAGDLLAPSLLAKFGDDRARFPTAGSVQALAGTCPVTDQSGQKRIVKFRRACDIEFRQIVQQWARCSLRQSAWANAYWLEVRNRCHGDNDAYRRLANRWLAICWKLWQTREVYDEAYHLKQRRLRRKPKR